jgi:hypothetical protein
MTSKTVNDLGQYQRTWDQIRSEVSVNPKTAAQINKQKMAKILHTIEKFGVILINKYVCVLFINQNTFSLFTFLA